MFGVVFLVDPFGQASLVSQVSAGKKAPQQLLCPFFSSVSMVFLVSRLF